MSLVAIGYQPPERVNATASAVDARTAATAEGVAPSVDDLIATNVAANIAQTADLPVASNVANLSRSLTAESMLTQNDTNIVAKPQIVQPTADSREVQIYKTKTGDTTQEVAKTYGISVKTLKWANDLTSDALEPGRTLKILPVDGVTYTTVSNDTIDSIAKRYGANKQQIIAFNDLELNGVKKGMNLIIPEGTLPTTERPGYETPASNNFTQSTSNFGGGSATANTLAGVSAGNAYVGGQCTWYAYERRAELGKPVGSFWGNANTWSINAGAAGFVVNGTPTVGSIMEGGQISIYGHVAVVESVNPGVSITISEMNAYRFGGGFNRIGTGQIPWDEAVSGAFRYIQ